MVTKTTLAESLKGLDIVAKSIKTTDNTAGYDIETEVSGYDDEPLLFVGRNLDVTNGRVDWDFDEVALSFQDTADEDDCIVQTYQIKHKIDKSVLKVHAHVIDKSTTDVIGWKMKYRLWKNGETAGAWSAEQDCTYLLAKVIDQLNIVTFSDIDISGCNNSDMVDIKFYRDDAVTGNAYLKQMDFHVKVSKLSGSKVEW